MITLPLWASIVGFILGPGSLLVTIWLTFLYRRQDVTDGIDKKNIISQKEYIETLEKEKIRLEGEVKVRDEQISNLRKLLENQKTDFQRQIDTLSRQIIEVKQANGEIASIADTLKIFVPLTNDVKMFHDADEKILAKLDQILSSHVNTPVANADDK